MIHPLSRRKVWTLNYVSRIPQFSSVDFTQFSTKIYFSSFQLFLNFFLKQSIWENKWKNKLENGKHRRKVSSGWQSCVHFDTNKNKKDKVNNFINISILLKNKITIFSERKKLSEKKLCLSFFDLFVLEKLLSFFSLSLKLENIRHALYIYLGLILPNL